MKIELEQRTTQRGVLDWLKVIGAWLGWLLALLQFLFSNPPPPVQ